MNPELARIRLRYNRNTFEAAHPVQGLMAALEAEGVGPTMELVDRLWRWHRAAVAAEVERERERWAERLAAIDAREIDELGDEP